MKITKETYHHNHYNHILVKITKIVILFDIVYNLRIHLAQNDSSISEMN